MKKIKIYQLPLEHKAKFRDYEFVTELGIVPQLSDYNIVWEGEVEDETNLDDIFRMLNINHPEDFKGHSLSVSDVVEKDGKFYYCDDLGWEEISFN